MQLVIPDAALNAGWTPAGPLPPLEIIDGQHRLFAFDPDIELDGEYELPVVLFDDIDISWQAYLFWTINITPKVIGPSLAGPQPRIEVRPRRCRGNAHRQARTRQRAA